MVLAFPSVKMTPTLTYINSLLILLTSFCGVLTLDPPVVQIIAWMESDDYHWKSGNEMELQGITHNKTTFVIPGDIHGLIIACNASYPIEWEFSPDEHLDPNMMVFSLYSIPRREGDGTARSPFLFSMKLYMYGDTNAFTGKYICRRADSDPNSYFGSVQTQIYIFWEGNSPPYIMGSGKTVTVSSYNQGSVRLPCPISFPDTDVFLQRKINVTNKDNTTEMKFVDLEFSTNTTGTAPITFDPTVGFVVDKPIIRNKSIDGVYKCLTAEKDDVVTVIVVPEKIPIPEKRAGRDKLDAGTKIYYNETSQQFVCCSNTDKPPNIFVFWCMSYVHCRIATPLIYHNMIEKMKMLNYGKTTNANCVYTSVYQGAYRCIGDGVDVTRVLFSTWRAVNGTYRREIFWSWDEITKEKQQRLVTMYLQIQQKPGSTQYFNPWYHYQVGTGPSPTLYSGQNVSFNCQPANFYYADGVAWKIRWKNQTTSYLDIATESYRTHYWFWTPPKTTFVIINTQMYSVTCMAPLWNSTDWVEKEYIITAKDPTSPQISSPNDDHLYWTLNDTEVSIRCVGTGDPAPKMMWLKNGKVVTHTKNVELSQQNGTLTIKFKLASYDVHGSYLCIAENIASRAEKMFNVFIEEGHPWVATVVITCVVLTFLTVLGVLGWRFKVTHDTASELRWRTS